MPAPAHTPTPWKAIRRHPDPVTNANLIYICSGDASETLTSCDGEIAAIFCAAHGSEGEANAIHVVRCVNSHDALVQAVRAAESSICDSGTNGAAQLIAQLRAALATLNA